MSEPPRGVDTGPAPRDPGGALAATLGFTLERWFRQFRRDLPWRRRYDPYHIWISEMLLQQTQMERGVAYYLRWMERFPDVASVAAATEDEVLKMWEGLGYYGRARNLHRAAQMVMARFDGALPGNATDLRLLPGIGPYTAGALLSIAFNLPVPAVDANAERVLARFLDEPASVRSAGVRRRFESFVREMMDHVPPRDISQGLMEFGALCCTSRRPSCAVCPGAPYCAAWRRGTVADRPSLPKKPSLRRMGRVAGVLTSPEGRVLLRRRPSEGLWGGLWEFPGQDFSLEVPPFDEVSPKDFLKKLPASVPEAMLAREFGWAVAVEAAPFLRVRYSYTVHRVEMAVFRCCPKEGMPKVSGAWRWVPPEELSSLALASGNRAVVQELGSSGGTRGREEPSSSAVLPLT